MNCRILVSAFVLSAASVTVASLPGAGPQVKQSRAPLGGGSPSSQRQRRAGDIAAEAGAPSDDLRERNPPAREHDAATAGGHGTAGRHRGCRVHERRDRGRDRGGASGRCRRGSARLRGDRFSASQRPANVRRVLPPSNQRSRRGSGATKPRIAVRLASGLAVVPSAQGDAIPMSPTPTFFPANGPRYASRCVASGRGSPSTDSRSRR